MTKKRLLKYAKQFGIFSLNENKKEIIYGSYGQLLLNSIKKDLLKNTLNKINNLHLFNNENILNIKDKCNLDYYLKSCLNPFDKQELKNSFGIINTFKQYTTQNNGLFGTQQEEVEEEKGVELNRLNEQFNLIYFSQNSNSISDLQKLRKKWWLRVLHCPEQISIDNNNNIIYTTTTSNNQKLILESIKLKENKEFSLINTNNYLLIETQIEKILDCLLVDSYKQQLNHDKWIFHLNIRLSPYKVCILINKQSKDLIKIGNDLNKLLLNEYIPFIKLMFNDDAKEVEEDLNSRYEYIDELGVPFSIILNKDTLINGFCLIRYRETSLYEKIHFTKIINYLKDLLIKLNSF